MNEGYAILALVAVALPAAIAIDEIKRRSLVRWRKVGGLTFVRAGRLRISFCITRKAAAASL